MNLVYVSLTLASQLLSQKLLKKFFRDAALHAMLPLKFFVMKATTQNVIFSA